MIIAIDTATETASVAIAHPEGGIAAELTWKAGRNHTMHLHPTLRHVMMLAGISRTDLTGVVATRGPGSFTGIRIGLATAKGLAQGLNVPIVGVGTLATAAYGAAHLGRTVWSVVSAGRGQYAAAAYAASDDGGVTRLVEEAILSPEELVSRMAERGEERVLTGEFDEALAEMGLSGLGSSLTIAPDVVWTRTAANAARLGLLRLQRGDVDDVATLEPLYLRPPAAVERAEAPAAANQ
ncbi:MAG: tRNA (adenosine(37)-N6)-threonylcarbamoyltransferase complex dimerization subunit type 1 TsaB [Dehalococcoidia bacterium]|nr:tRNA (adenosine(37)-N6)-threonylcarbamoyltransferase complex dimerization subunit type 1 TsaB [Dehalococcoidia bacterium]